jgi:hypothetical protein
MPYQHRDTMAFLSAVKAKYKPTRVVMLGDLYDHHALSFHPSDPDLPSAGDELRRAIREAQPLYKLFPVADILDSNHDSLAFRKAKFHGIPVKYLTTYQKFFDTPKRWTWHNELIVKLPGGEECFFHHGISKNVAKVVRERGLCVVQGHYHTEFRIEYCGTPRHLLWGMNVGCSIDSKAMAFEYDKLNLARPVIGHGIIIDGQPKLLPMVLSGRHRWNGKVP